MTKAELALARVHELYLMQTHLIRALESDLSDPVARREVRRQMKDFEALLQQADHRYMGGEDVLESLKKLPEEMTLKLKSSPVIVKKRSMGKRR